VRVALDVNGVPCAVDSSPWRRLLDVLREDLRLTGTKEGCGEGECGACTVMLDGEAVNSCLVAVGQCDGRSVTTVEGLAKGDVLHAVQRALVACGGAQCGICTPGMLIASEALLRRRPDPSDEEIREAIAGNLCRCTGYQRIVESIRKASEIKRASEAAQ